MYVSGEYNYHVKEIVSNKINQLWIGDSTAASAYCRLKGVEMQNGILLNAKITSYAPTMHLKYTRANSSAAVLIKFRKKFPEVTKEEVLECLASIKEI